MTYSLLVSFVCQPVLAKYFRLKHRGKPVKFTGNSDALLPDKSFRSFSSFTPKFLAEILLVLWCGGITAFAQKLNHQFNFNFILYCQNIRFMKI